MAFTQNELDAFKPEGIESEKWSEIGAKVIALHESDIKGLIDNEKALKFEKTSAIEKYNNEKSEWEKSKADYESKLAEKSNSLDELTKKLSEKDGNSKALEAAFEQKEKTLTETFTAKENEYKANIDSLGKKISELEVGVFQRDCEEAFTKAIVGKNINANELGTVKKLALGENYSQFARRDIGDGKSIITRSDGKNIEDSLNEFLSSSTGKLFILNGNSGGGADGGKNTPPQGTEMSKAEFDKLSPQEKVEAVTKYKII